jgi:hypothetical protein
MTGDPMPVDPQDSVHVLRVLDAARVSAAERSVVTVRGRPRPDGLPLSR